MVFYHGINRFRSENLKVFNLSQFLILIFNLILYTQMVWNLFFKFLFQNSIFEGRDLLNFRLKTLLQAGQIREDGTNCRLHIKIDHV